MSLLKMNSYAAYAPIIIISKKCKKGGLLTAQKRGVNLPFLGYKCLLIHKMMEHRYDKIVWHIIETFLRYIYLILFAC